MNKQKLAWHRPRVITIEAPGHFRVGTLLTLFDGRTVIVPNIPKVVNSTDAERKARDDARNRKYVAANKQRKRNANAEASEHNKTNKHRHKKPDHVRAVTVWAKESEIVEALCDPELAMAPLGRPLTRREERGAIERVFTARLRSTFKNNR